MIIIDVFEKGPTLQISPSMSDIDGPPTRTASLDGSGGSHPFFALQSTKITVPWVIRSDLMKRGVYQKIEEP
jgi:hypothetical protein